MELVDLASDVVSRARSRGASDAECLIQEGSSFSVTVRLGEIEKLKDSGSKGIGLRVLRGKRAASTYSSDFSGAGIEKLIQSALESVAYTSQDSFAGLPDAGELGLGKDPIALDLYYGSVLDLSPERKIEMAKRCEQAALEGDPRIRNSEGATFSSGWSRHVLVNSRGFAGDYKGTRCALFVVPVAESDGQKERDSWYTLARGIEALEDPEEVGRIAAQRALRRLHTRKIATAKLPVVFEPRTAKSLLGHIFAAVSGDAVYRDASFLAGRLGEQIADRSVTIVDDGLLPGGFGTSPFDDEGVASGRTLVVRDGVLDSYLLNCYAARRLGLKTTGNASRGLTGNPGVGPGNFILQPGKVSPQKILESVTEGFYVTELLGFGVNLVTGDYSRGAAGFWIDRGELAFPVSEVTIAGNLKHMLRDIEMIGSDPDFRGAIVSPTIKIRELTIAGG